MTQEEYLAEFVRVLQRHFQPDDSSGSMTAARIGLLVRQVMGKSPQEVGFPQLKDVLAELERRSLIRTGDNTKSAYAVWLTSASATAEGAANTTGQTITIPIRRLRQSVWHAFVAAVPTGRRFLNRETGEVRLGQDAVPAPTENWVEIEPVDQAEQRTDAEQFLSRETDITPLMRTALESDRWYVDLPRQLDHFLASRWKRRRTQQIVECVEKWRRRHDLGDNLVYQPKAKVFPPRRPFETTENLRELLLAAINRMSTEELLALSLPSRHVVRQLRPDLVQE